MSSTVLPVRLTLHRSRISSVVGYRARYDFQTTTIPAAWARATSLAEPVIDSKKVYSASSQVYPADSNQRSPGCHWALTSMPQISASPAFSIAPEVRLGTRVELRHADLLVRVILKKCGAIDHQIVVQPSGLAADLPVGQRFLFEASPLHVEKRTGRDGRETARLFAFGPREYHIWVSFGVHSNVTLGVKKESLVFPVPVKVTACT